MRQISFAMALVMLFCGMASAHAFLDHAEPEVGAKVDKAPSVIKIWFTADILVPGSGIDVFDADGNRVDKKDVHVDAKDTTLLIVSLKSISAGTFKVDWHAVTHDTHKTHGDFSFTMKVRR